jgi:hypothetical protein
MVNERKSRHAMYQLSEFVPVAIVRLRFTSLCIEISGMAGIIGIVSAFKIPIDQTSYQRTYFRTAV